MLNKIKLLSGNTLKIIACVSMLIDHIGVMFFPRVIVLRIIGRIAFPIFAFMIAEGARYTKNKLRYLLGIASLALICQIGYAFVSDGPFLCVLVTFTLSILLIYALQYFKKTLFSMDSPVIKIILTGLLFALGIVAVYFLNKLSRVEYGFFGVMLPVIASLPHMPKGAPASLSRLDTPTSSAIFASIATMLVPLDSTLGAFQLCSILSVPLFFMYSGKRGKLRLKYFFYIFYPVHLVVLAGIAFLIVRF